MNNPYIGPKPYSDTETDQRCFYGRSDEITEVRALLRTERIILIHSPSGAGKTSLIQAGLIPKLIEDTFRIINPIRLGLPLPEGQKGNRFVFSAIRSIERAVFKETFANDYENDFVGLGLDQYFTYRSGLRGTGGPVLLVFDQFEDIFTLDSGAHLERVEFFTQIATILQNRLVWAVFAMREEYVAHLDQYTRLVPTQFSARYHLDYLTPLKAESAITKPAEKFGVSYSDEAIESLLNDLSALNKQDELYVDVDQASLSTLPVIDPLHLQLVCERLWEKNNPKPGDILNKSLIDKAFKTKRRWQADELSPVDQALSEHYNDVITNTVKSLCTIDPLDVFQGKLRYWIDDSLIERGKYRRQSLVPENDRVLSAAVRILENKHILRPAVRLRKTWYEIAHDRLVDPIIHANEAWYEKKLPEFEKAARSWCSAGTPSDFSSVKRKVILDYKKRIKEHNNKDRPICESEYLKYCLQRNRSKFKNFINYLLVLIVFFLSVGLIAANKNEWFAINDLKNQITMNTLKEKKAKEDLNTTISLLQTKENTLTAVKSELEEKQGEMLESKTSAIIQRLKGAALAQRWRYGNHDKAILLARLADQRLKDAQDKNITVRESRLRIHSTTWTAIDANPFSQTLSNEFFNSENILSFNSFSNSALVTIGKTEDKLRIMRILIQNRATLKPSSFSFSWKSHCGYTNILSTSNKHFIIHENNKLKVYTFSECKNPLKIYTVQQKIDTGIPPVWGKDGQLVAMLTEKYEKKGVIYSKLIVIDINNKRKILIPIKIQMDDRNRTILPTSLNFLNSTISPRIAIGYEKGRLGVLHIKDNANLVYHGLWKKWPIAYRPDNVPDGGSSIIFVGNIELAKNVRSILNQTNSVAIDSVNIKPGFTNKSLDNKSQKADWKIVVFKGSNESQGGKIFLYNLENDKDIFEIYPNTKSQLRENIQQERGRLARHRLGVSYSAAAMSDNGRWLIVATDQGLVYHLNLKEAVIKPYFLPTDRDDWGTYEEVANSQEDININEGLATQRIILSGMHSVIMSAHISNDGEQVVAASAVEGLRFWSLGNRLFGKQRKIWNITQPQALVSKCDENVGYIYDIRFNKNDDLVVVNNKGKLVFIPKENHTKNNFKGVKWLPCIPSNIATSIRSVDILDNYVVIGKVKGVVQILDRSVPNANWKLLTTKIKNKSSLTDTAEHRDGLWSVRFHPKSTLDDTGDIDLATADYKGRIVLWDLNKTKKVNRRILDLPESPPTGNEGHQTKLSFSPKGCKLAAVYNKIIRIFNFQDEDGSCSSDITLNPREIDYKDLSVNEALRSIAFGPDGKYLAAAGKNGVIYWWEDITSDKDVEPYRLEGTIGTVTALAFLPEKQNGKPVLASVAMDGLLRLWRLEESSSEPLTLRGSGYELYSLAVNSEGTIVSAGDSNGNILFWNLDVRSYECDFIIRNLTKKEWAKHVGGDKNSYKPVCPKTPTDILSDMSNTVN